jgi:hypothetical protein
MTRYANFSDLELVTLAESMPLFQQDGIAREVLLRLANTSHHNAASSDVARVARHRDAMPSNALGTRHARYNNKG